MQPILQPEDFWIRAPTKGIVVFALPGERGLTELTGDFKIQFHDRQGDFYWSVKITCWLDSFIFYWLILFCLQLAKHNNDGKQSNFKWFWFWWFWQGMCYTWFKLMTKWRYYKVINKHRITVISEKTTRSWIQNWNSDDRLWRHDSRQVQS